MHKQKNVYQNLYEWYRANGRHELPWRQTDNPYHIWVSEIMLQQTQVKTVLERFYHPFLSQFPTIEALAAADDDAVRKRWQGLGYYRRAANLHKAAGQLADQATAKGKPATVPRDVAALMALPGIGRNTAHAIAAFAFHDALPVMEANLKRVLARLYAYENPSENELWHAAEQSLDRAQPYHYNQAMMDLGALICTPKAPDCVRCPLAVSCKGRNSPERYPIKKRRQKLPIRKRAILLVCRNKNSKPDYAVIRREGAFLHGLYGFIEVKPEVVSVPAQFIGNVKQAYSHFTLEADIFVVEASKADIMLPETVLWRNLDEFERLPHSGAETKILKLMR